MRAMILAAGRGERMGELTADTPKPLLKVAGYFLIEYALWQLKKASINDVVINTAYLGNKIQQKLGDGHRYGLNIIYSHEVERLETGGGIFNALPYLGKDPFVVLSADVICDYPLARLPLVTEGAHLVLVPNPSFHPQGDFALSANKIRLNHAPTFTFANIGLYHPTLFSACKPGFFRLIQVLTPAIHAGLLTGEIYQQTWFNVGTPQDLTLAHQYFSHPAHRFIHT